MSFSGFPAETITFLEGLAQNNSKDWFEAHRADYEAYHLEPAKEFILAIGPKLKALSKTVRVVPKINGSIFRINRDTRFGADKSPYKTTLDLWFWEGEERSWDVPGYYMRITADRLIVGAGLHRFSPVMLAAYRAAVLDSKAGPALVKVVNGLDDLALAPAERNTLPKGFDAKHKRAPFLMHLGLHAEVDVPHPKSLYSSRLVQLVLNKFQDGMPLCRWIHAHVLKKAKAATN